MKNLPKAKPILCPSAQPAENSSVFGIVLGTLEAPLIQYLPQPLPFDDELMDLSEEVKPGEIFRISAPCAEMGCKHFDGKSCNLAERIVEHLPAIAKTPPKCAIRHDCRWFKQHGVDACFRCPQVITESYDPSVRFVAGY